MNAHAATTNPACFRCAAFFITHNPAFPYGCRTIGCQSKRLPGVEVVEASGQPCLMFAPKSAGAARTGRQPSAG